MTKFHTGPKEQPQKLFENTMEKICNNITWGKKHESVITQKNTCGKKLGMLKLGPFPRRLLFFERCFPRSKTHGTWDQWKIISATKRCQGGREKRKAVRGGVKGQCVMTWDVLAAQWTSRKIFMVFNDRNPSRTYSFELSTQNDWNMCSRWESIL